MSLPPNRHPPSRSSPSIMSNSSLPNTSSPSIENENSHNTKLTRHRVTRACDACRKNKVKCPLNDSGSCQNCLKASRPCTFENAGVRREKPPSKHDIQQLSSRIQTLEKLLAVLAPNIDLKSLPRTPEQARGIVNQSRIQSGRNNLISETPPTTRPSDLSDPDDVFSAIRLLNDLQITPSDQDQPLELGASSSSHSTHSLPSSPPQNQQDQESKPSYTRAVTQMWVEKFVPLHHLPNFQLPPQQLGITLISLFFDQVNPFENILHRGEFMRLYETDLIHTDRSFQALCFALFAAGSTFSSDPYVMLPTNGGPPNRQTAGGPFLHACLSLVCPAHLPTCTLFDLQTMAVLCHVTSIICSPLTVWSWLGLNLRRVQNAAAHRSSAPQWKTSLMKDQLRKRAVWYLAVTELSFSLILGRTSCIKADTIDLDLPLPLSDDALSRYCSENHPSPSQMDPEPRSFLSPSLRTKPPVDFPMFFVQKFGIALQKLFAVRMNPSSKIGERDKDAIVALAQEIESFFDASSLHSPWDPTILDTVALVTAGKRIIIHLTFRILLRRLLIFEEPTELQVCFQSANQLIDTLDHLRNRGALEHMASWAPYTTVPATSMQLYIACNECDVISAADRANAWVGVHRCINVLSTLAATSSLAAQLQNRLEQILQACVTNELFPKANEGSSHAHTKREAGDVLDSFSDAGRSSCQSKRPSTRPHGTGSFEYPDGLPPSFPIGGSHNSVDEGSFGQPCFRNPWSHFDSSLFHHLGRPPRPAADAPTDFSVWTPAYPPPDPPATSLLCEFLYDNVDLSHSFLS